LKDKKFNFAFKIGWRARVAGEPNASFSNWRDIVDDVRTILQRQTEYIYIPDLSPRVQ